MKDIVGHKTFIDEHGNYSHEPLTKEEAEAVLAECKMHEANRAAQMPDEETAIRTMWNAYQRLKELGWEDIFYCPKDGTIFDAIEPGSTGIGRCHYKGEWPNGHWWVESHGDFWPSRPILYRRKENNGAP